MNWTNVGKMLMTKLPTIIQIVETFRGSAKGAAKAKEVEELILADMATYHLKDGRPVLAHPKVKAAVNAYMAAGVALANAVAEAEAESVEPAISGESSPPTT